MEGAEDADANRGRVERRITRQTAVIAATLKIVATADGNQITCTEIDDETIAVKDLYEKVVALSSQQREKILL